MIIRRYNGEVAAGTIHSLNPHSTCCNAVVAIPIPGGIVQDSVAVGDCYSADEAYAAMAEKQAAKPQS